MKQSNAAWEAVIGLEVHSELASRTKMFCACEVVDTTTAAPNTSVCPVCLGLPGALPVTNLQAVELGLRVALALNCRVLPQSVFARKNYFYPDLPKGYQISQFEQPLAVDGRLPIRTSEGLREIRIRRVHLEEDTGKLSHVDEGGAESSLIDLNRSGLALLEIVSEPDLHTAEEVAAYGRALQRVLRTVGASSADMEKGAMRIEPNISLHRTGEALGTRVEVKNLNSFRALERATQYQIEEQIRLLERGQSVLQQTLGWDEQSQVTVPQRSKEEAHDYRYFPEPDLPVVLVDSAWLEQIRAKQPEMPWDREARYMERFKLNESEAAQLVDEPELAAVFEDALGSLRKAPPRMAATWLCGEVTAWLGQNGKTLNETGLKGADLADLLDLASDGTINLTTAKSVLNSMLAEGLSAAEIVERDGLRQQSDDQAIREMVCAVLNEFSDEVQKFRAGKASVANWLYGQVMRRSGGRANPGIVKTVLEDELKK